MRRVDSTPYSWLVGGESDRGTKRVALSQPCRDERVYLCLLSVYFFCPSSPFSHVISSIGRVMAGISRREVSSEFQPWLAGNSRSTWLGPCKVPSEFFFLFRTRNIPVASISVFRNRDIWHSASGKWQRWFHDGNIVVNCSRPVTRNRHHRRNVSLRSIEASKSCRKLIFVTSSIFATGGGKVASAYSQ